MLLPRDRQERLLREIALRGAVRSSSLAADLGVDVVTVRRDVAALARQGLVTPVHGGAVAVRGAEPAPATVLVGVLVPLAEAYFSQVVLGVEKAAARRGARLVLGVSGYRPDVERAQVARLLELGVHGLVIAPTTSGRGAGQDPGAADDVEAWAAAIDVPLVLVERRFESRTSVRELDRVHTDHAHGAHLALEHLRGLGHARVGLAVYDGTPTAPWVRAGHAEARARLGLEEAPDVALPKGGDTGALADTFVRLLDDCARTRTRAVVVHTDVHAGLLVEAARGRGVRVPDDLAVVAYDDDVRDQPLPLTAVSAARRELGAEALDLLLDRLESGPGAARPARHVAVLPRLEVRSSTVVATAV